MEHDLVGARLEPRRVAIGMVERAGLPRASPSAISRRSARARRPRSACRGRHAARDIDDMNGKSRHGACSPGGVAHDSDASRRPASKRCRRLRPALAAMTALQALVVAGAVRARRAGAEARHRRARGQHLHDHRSSPSAWRHRSTAGSSRAGSARAAVAALCALAVVARHGGCAASAAAWRCSSPGCCIGLAFGPETPASSTLLSKLASPAAASADLFRSARPAIRSAPCSAR